MIRHIVLFKFHDGVGWDDPRTLNAELGVLELPKYIPEILEWECGRNITNRNIAYDFALIGNFADRNAVEKYLYHPVHVRGVEEWREFSSWVVADIEVV